ncbi:MAG: hypothetical protein IT302_12475 [Dehalococcoidia bacterium]|nr:hypothetical protein [Dehalococcoidia bacterium]
MIRSASGLTLMAVILTAAAACGGGQKTADTVDPLPASTPNPTASVTAEAPPAIPATDSLQKMLLRLDDMPAGWSNWPDDDNDDDDGWCGKPTAARAVPSSARASAQFQQSDFGPFLAHTVTSYKGDDARRAFDYNVDLLKDCRTWTEPDENGHLVTYTISPLSFPKLGDQTFAFRLTMTPVPLVGLVTADAVYVRRGTIVSNVIAMALGPGGTSGVQLEALVRKAVDRIR